MSIEKEKFSFTYKHEGWRFEGQETKLDIQVFHKEGKNPIFVVNESLDNKGPGLEHVTSDLAGGMMNLYDLRPEKLQWYEQQPNGQYTQIGFRTTQINPETDVATKWLDENKEYNIDKSELEKRIASGIVEQPDEISRAVQQGKQWERLDAPAEGQAERAKEVAAEQARDGINSRNENESEYMRRAAQVKEGINSRAEHETPEQQQATQEAQQENTQQAQQQNTQDLNQQMTY